VVVEVVLEEELEVVQVVTDLIVLIL